MQTQSREHFYREVSKMENNVTTFKKGLVVERLGESQANIFFNDRIYCVQEDQLSLVASRITEDHSSINIYFGGFDHGCIIVVENLAMSNNNYALAEAVAYLCDYIAKRSIF